MFQAKALRREFSRQLTTNFPDGGPSSNLQIFGFSPVLSLNIIIQDSLLDLLGQQSRSDSTRSKKNTCGSGFPTDPIFSADPIIFFNTIDCVTLFSPGWLRAARTVSVPKWHL